jgi:D-alanine-D-alanine ligase
MARPRVSKPLHLHVLLLVDPEIFNASDPHFLKVTPDTEAQHFVLAGLKALRHQVSVLPFKRHRKGGRTVADDIMRLKPDIVFNFVEHMGGDRRLACNVPALLDVLGVPYTGSSAIGRITIDKAASKLAVSSVGFPVPPFVVLPVGSAGATRRMLDFPAIVKPQFGGASEGLKLTSVVHSERELNKMAREIHRRFDAAAICERFIDGRELSVGLVEDKNDVLVLPIRETVFGRADSGGPDFCTERVKESARYRDRWGIRYEQARLPSTLDRRIRTLCKEAFRVLGLTGYARMDIRLDTDGNPVFLEANANPDLSPRYFGIMASWMGLTYEDVIVKILRAGLNRKSAWQWRAQ